MDTRVLTTLSHELSYRAVPRAQALREQVEKLLAAIKAGQLIPQATPENATPMPTASVQSASVETAQPAQPSLFSSPAASSTASTRPVEGLVMRPQAESRVAATSAATSATLTTATAPATAAAVRTVSPPAMSADEACKALGVALGARWEVIEQARRDVVRESSPARTARLTHAQTERLLERARVANAAMLSLARIRST